MLEMMVKISFSVFMLGLLFYISSFFSFVFFANEELSEGLTLASFCSVLIGTIPLVCVLLLKVWG